MSTFALIFLACSICFLAIMLAPWAINQSDKIKDVDTESDDEG